MAAACLMMAVLLVSQSAVGALRGRSIAFAEVLTTNMHEVLSSQVCITSPACSRFVPALLCHHVITDCWHASCSFRLAHATPLTTSAQRMPGRQRTASCCR
jgi:hypothetical protein